MTWAWAGFMAVVVAREGEPVKIVSMESDGERAWQVASNPGRTMEMQKRGPLLDDLDRPAARCIRVDRQVSNDWYHGKGHLPAGKAVTIHPDGVLVYVERKT